MNIGPNLLWALTALAAEQKFQRSKHGLPTPVVNYLRGITKPPMLRGRKLYVGSRWLQRTLTTEYMQALISGDPMEISTIRAYQLTGIKPSITNSPK